MKPYLHLRSVITCLLLISFMFHANSQDDYLAENNINSSNDRNSNINSAKGTLSQDLKRSTGFFTSSKFFWCSCVLVNTVKQNKIPYILTKARCLTGFEINREYEKYFSFDYELPHANRRGDQITDHDITGVWKAKFKILLKNQKTDIALLQLVPGSYKPELLENAYAIGWDNTITNNVVFQSMNHPYGDHKKIFVNPSKSWLKVGKINADFDSSGEFLEGIFYSQRPPWDNKNTYPQDGSYGSGGLSREGHLIGIAVSADDKKSIYSAITNNWKVPRPSESKGLAHYLDSDESFLNSIPGGYINDLESMNRKDFSLTVKPKSTGAEPYQTPFLQNPDDKTKLHEDIRYIKANTFFKYTNIEILDNWFYVQGIKLDGDLPDNAEIILSLMYADKDESQNYKLRLLQGYFLNKQLFDLVNTPFGKYDFFPFDWECQPHYPDFPKCDEGLVSSLDIKNSLLSHLKKLSADENKIVTGEDKISTVVRLENIGSQEAKVKAISFSGESPLNALQLFKPNEVKKAFHYYKYKESRGIQTTSKEGGIEQDYYIDNIEIKFLRYVDNGTGSCEALPKKTIRKINTANNGGYLNLVNHIQRINGVYASESACPKNKLTITLGTNTSTNKHYGAWIDYFRDKKAGNQPNETDNYTYNFRYDAKPHEVEELEVGTANGLAIDITHEIPREEELKGQFNDNNILKTRLRVAIAQTPVIGHQTLTPDGIYNFGEVEDYLIHIKKRTDAEKAELLATTADINLSVNQRVQNPENEPTDGNEVANSFHSNLLSYFNQVFNFAANSGGSSTTNSQQAMLQMQYPIAISLEDNTRSGYLISGEYLKNLGRAERIFSPLLQPLQNIFSQQYENLPNGADTDWIALENLNPANFSNLDNPFNPENNDNINIGNPANDNSPLNKQLFPKLIFSPPDGNNPFGDSDAILADPENKKLVWRVYNNIVRIAAHFYDPSGDLFGNYKSNQINNRVLNNNDDYWWIYDSFITALNEYKQTTKKYNQVALLDDLITRFYNRDSELLNPRFIIPKVLLFIHYNREIIFNALPQENPIIQAVKIPFLIYKYMLPYYIAMRNIPWFIEQRSHALNLAQNGGKIMIDAFGNWISKSYEERTLVTELTVKNYPETEFDLAVIYHNKGSNIEVILGIDHEGYLIYRLRLGKVKADGTAYWQEIKATEEKHKINKGNRIKISVRFDKGKLSLFLNNDEIVSRTIEAENGVTLQAIEEFLDFTDENYGARWGGPVIDFSDHPYVGPTLVDIDAIFYSFLGFGRALDNESIELLALSSENTTPTSARVRYTNEYKKSKNSSTVHIEPDTALETSDFSIFPNPAKDELNILVEVGYAGSLYIGIYDLSGKRVYETKEPNINEGHQLITLRKLKFSAGQYVVKVKAGNVTKSEQVVFE